MLQFLYSWRGYRILKSGLLLDFYFKRFIAYVIYEKFFSLSFFFLDKYLIEYTIFQVSRLSLNYLLIFKGWKLLSPLVLLKIIILNIILLVFYIYMFY